MEGLPGKSKRICKKKEGRSRGRGVDKILGT